MDFANEIALATMLQFTGLALGTIVSALILYLVIRMGVFHGLRAHTRWVDDGKDYEKIR